MFSPTPLQQSARSFIQTVASTWPSLSAVHSPYFVPRNTRGNLPVYTDIRNGGTRYLVLVRNVDGDANVCTFKFIIILQISYMNSS
jgi:Mitochondrial large subunit ribosomal protein (Img2)